MLRGFVSRSGASAVDVSFCYGEVKLVMADKVGDLLIEPVW